MKLDAINKALQERLRYVAPLVRIEGDRYIITFVANFTSAERIWSHYEVPLNRTLWDILFNAADDILPRR